MNFLAGIGLKIWGYVAAFGGLVIAVLVYGSKKKREGRKEVKDAVNAETTETVLEIVEEDKAIEKDIDTKSDDDVLAELLRGAKDNTNNR